MLSYCLASPDTLQCIPCWTTSEEPKGNIRAATVRNVDISVVKNTIILSIELEMFGTRGCFYTSFVSWTLKP